MFFGILCIILGSGIWALNVYGGGFNWGRDWPFLLLVLGAYILFKHVRKKKTGKDRRLKSILKDVEKGKIDAKEAIDEMEEK